MSALEAVGWFVGGGLTVGSIVGWALARANRYVDAYLDQKGKQLATKEDFKQLLAQQAVTAAAVENVKASINADVWLSQEQWKLKREAYIGLVGALAEMHLLLQGFVEAHTSGIEGPMSDTDKLKDRMAQLSVDFNKGLRVAGLWLSRSSLDELKSAV